MLTFFVGSIGEFNLTAQTPDNFKYPYRIFMGMIPKIKKITAREILDSKGIPTIETELSAGDFTVSAKVPSGVSTGIHEAVELRDNDKYRYNGKGVLKAVENVNKMLSKRITGYECTEQSEIDKLMIELDGTENKSKLGANAILSVSMAVCKAGALANKLGIYEYICMLAKNKKFVMPVPYMLIAEGGAHAGIENDIQEYMIVPVKFKSFQERLRAGVETYHKLKELLKKEFGHLGELVGYEGGLVPPIKEFEKKLEYIQRAIDNAGYTKEISIALDCASSEFYENDTYTIRDKNFNSGELIDYYTEISEMFGVISIEDGLGEDDWSGWQELTKKLGNKLQIVGDDLLVTNPERIKKAIIQNSANAMLLKINQIGTITESLESSRLCYENDWKVMVSHRSGETEDTFIADLVVGINSGQCKFGAPVRGERTAKYNRLLRIEEELFKYSN